MNLNRKFKFFADYFQFVLMDESSEDDFSEIWTDEALERMLAVGELAVCPGTLRNIEVDVEVRVVPTEPSINVAAHDHVVEGSIEIPTGKLVVMGCTEYLPDAQRIELSPGTYQLLFLVDGVDSIKTEWEPAEDKYTVYLWSGQLRAPKLLKHWRKGAV
jgi:hypothetical protein